MSSSLSKKALWLSWFATPLVVGGLVVAAPFAGVPHAFDQGAPLSASQMNANFASLRDYANGLDAELSTLRAELAEVTDGATYRVPPGTVVAFAGPDTQLPDGWLLCDGQVLSSAQYPALYAAIGTAHGHGTGAAGSFTLPDYRGLFLRGVAYGATTDPDKAGRTEAAAGGNVGNAVGSRQLAETGQHDHGGGDHRHYLFGLDTAGTADIHLAPDSSVAWVVREHGTYDYAMRSGGPAQWGRSGASGPTITPAGGAETRPTNAYVNYIIKL